jgi:2-amino-4-hydroxy-6-hydroxymethyldihydropteridine diphosphokinase
MTTAYLGLGGNLGNRLAFLRGGRDALAARPEIEVLRSSPVYETEAVGGPPGNPLFLNVVIEVRTSFEAHELLAACLASEDAFGRSRPLRWAPRTLDIDILFFGDQVVREERLVIPHPRLHERAFVLVPLLKLAAELRHPLLEKTVTELAAGVAELKPLRESW